MTTSQGYEDLTPETDPFNQSPRTDRGFAVRIHSRDGEIRYVNSALDREAIIQFDQGLYELDVLANLPWYRKLWRWMTLPRF